MSQISARLMVAASRVAPQELNRTARVESWVVWSGPPQDARTDQRPFSRTSPTAANICKVTENSLRCVQVFFRVDGGGYFAAAIPLATTPGTAAPFRPRSSAACKNTRISTRW
jgi:hypothetical protein